MDLNNATTPSSVSEPFATLASHQYVQLTTFRKTGVGVPTQIWFANQDGNIYVTTVASTGKVKRIRNNGRVTLAPCKANGQLAGTAVAGTARILSSSEGEVANRALTRKYGWLYRIFTSFQKLRHLQQTFLEIQPGDDAG